MVELLCGEIMELLTNYYLEKDEKLRNSLIEQMLENYRLYLINTHYF